MMTFTSSTYSMFPSIAQLVERWTVVVPCQTSIGRWFKSGSKEFFFTSTQLSTTDLTHVIVNAAILFLLVKAAICFNFK